MTFPAYRHMLRLEPTQRHPGELEQRDVVPLGVAALMETTLVGLALAEAPRSAGAGAPELLSLFVQPELRGRGIATDMLAQLESELLGRGFHTLDAVYMTGKPSLPALERVFAKRSWSPPKTRVVTLRFTPEEATHTPWWGRVRLGADYEIFPWTEMTPEGLEQIRQSDERSHWVAVGLEAWRHGRTAFDPVSSLGLRHRGEVVGWVINHRVTEDLVRFTCSYMRPDLARRGRIMPLYTESIKRVAGTSCRWCSFTTPIEYPQMVEFVKTRCAPYASFFGETRGTSKRLDDL
jgi:GNAT superfamily N-acetyltransferase